jgi:putative molybdopterin biosynthesis protein
LGIDFLLELAALRLVTLRPKVIAIGSTGGISAVGRGEADVAGIHLLHPDTGAYNEWALEARKMEGQVVLVRGYRRNQVLVIRPGGPRRVTSLSDLLAGKTSFINRNPGSGTRALLEAKLKELARDRGLRLEDLVSKIPGWEVEAKSHSAVATAVAAGRADAGVCVETAAVRAGLARIPVAEESFDFLVRADRMDAPAVQALLAALRSPEFARELPSRVPGLRTDDETGKVVWPREGGGRAPRRRKA